MCDYQSLKLKIFMKRVISFSFIFYIFFSQFQVQAQSGPGGVGNADGTSDQPKNVLWLDANSLGLTDGTDVNTWADQSGNGYSFGASTGNTTNTLGDGNTSQLPSFESDGSSTINGFPVVRFDDTNEERLVVNPFTGFPDDEITTVIVFKTANNGEGIVSYAVTGSDNEYLIYDANAIRTYVNSNNDAGGDFDTPASTESIFLTRWTNAGGGLLHYKNGTEVNSATISNGASMADGGSLALGGEQDEVDDGYQTSQNFGGDIAEVIIYDAYLNDVQQAIVENYLSAKYNISFATSSNDKYAGDEVGNGDHDFDVIGIGQENGEAHEAAAGSGIELFTYDGSLDTDDEFVFAGHNNTTNVVSTANLGTDITARWARTWYVDRTSAGTLNTAIAFDFGEGIGGQFPQDKNGYVLLKWNGSSYDSVAVATADKYVSGDRVVFQVSNALLTDGIYTLGTTDNTESPLTGGPNKTWYSYANGDWDDPDTWTLDGAAFPLYENDDNEIPTSIDNVVISSGKTVTIPGGLDDIDILSLEVAGRLDLTTTSGHDFTTISGNGRIRMAGSSGVDNFPDGDVSDFIDAVNGGTVVVYGTGLSLDQARTFNHLEIDLTNNTDEAVLLADYTLNGNLTITEGIVKFNDNSATTDLFATVSGNVLVEADGQIAVGTANARHQFNLYSDFVNNGTVAFTNRVAADYNNEATDGIVDVNFLSDNQDQEIQCNGTTKFYRIEIDKGTDDTYILDISASSGANFQLFGPANDGHSQVAQLTDNDNALGLLRGTVRINANVEIPVLSNDGTYNISEAAQLWVNGGTVTKPAGSAIVPYGVARVSAGTFEALVQNGFTIRDNGSIQIEGGTVNANQIRTSILGSSNVGSYIQSGGTVNVLGGTTQTDYYVFDLTYPDNVFIMTGGVLNIEEAVGKGGIFINSDPENINVTEGIVNMKINNTNDFIVTSRAPFYNVTMTNEAGNSAQFVLDAAVDVGSDDVNLAAQPLVVLNNFTIEANTTFDHNGNNVEIGRNLTVQLGADYVYDSGKPNTTTINGTANSLLAFYNRTGGSGDEQEFHNLIIDKPAGVVVSLASGKADVTGSNNNLLNIKGDAFKVLSGTLDQGFHSIRVNSDTLVNYDVLGIYDPANATPATTANGNNDMIKFRNDDFVLITADTSTFGVVRLNNNDKIVTLQSDVYFQYLEFRFGRIDLQTHNLKIDVLDINLATSAEFDYNGDGDTDDTGEERVNNPSDMLITSGNASDGGLSLYIEADGTYTFPFGIGTDATDLNAGTSKYTPATVTVSNYTQPGYITINPVDGDLETTASSGDLLSYYWHVRYEGFNSGSNLPTVTYDFVYDDADIAGTESNYVGGKVLDTSPYTRSGEDFEDADQNGTIDGGEGAANTASVDNASNTITFDYNGTDNTGFPLESANYTAGEPSRFLGAPQVFYNTNVGRRDWNNGTKWSSTNDGIDDGDNDYPQAGDIAIIQNYGDGNQNAWVNGNIDITVAKLVFDNSNGGWSPRLWMTKRDANLDLGVVEGAGTFYMEVTSTQIPAFSNDTDLGLFSNNSESVFNFKIDADNQTVDMPNNIVEYPNLRIEGGNGGNDDDNRILQTSIPVTINGYTRMDRSSRFRANHDITIKDDLRVTWQENRCTFEIGDDREVGVTIEGDLRLENGSGNDNTRIVVKNDNTNGYEHIIEVWGDIIIEDVNTGSSVFDLYNGTSPNNNAILRLSNAGSQSFTNASSIIPDLYRVVMDKGSSNSSTFSIETDFNLNGLTDNTPKAVELQNGTLIMNNPGIDIDLTTGGGNFSIPAAAGLEVQEGTVRVSGDDTGILLDGLLRVSNNGNAYLNGAGNGNNYIQYSASGNASLEISDNGELTVGSQIRRGLNSSTGVLQYTQTGGTVIVGENAAPEANRGVFEITSDVGSSFTHTGGDLYIVRQNGANPSIAALYLNPASSNVSGSVITVGNASTPASQTITIDAGITLDNVVISNASTNNPSVKMRVRPLNVGGSLTINNGTTLNANALALNLSGGFVNNGTFTANGNTTTFNASGAQSLSGSSATTFWNVNKENNGTLTLAQSIVVGNDLTISDGTLADDGNTISVYRNLVHNATHTSNAGEGIKLVGTAQQQITRSGSGSSTFGVLTINNLNGVIIPEGNGYDFTITESLRMAGGVFNIGSSLLTINESATIEEVSSFGNTNMIQTNSSFSDAGVQKLFAAGTTTDFIFPVGESQYTPATLVLSDPGYTSGSSAGNIVVIPAREVHPVINNGVEDTSPTDMDNVLQYYWTIDGNGLSGFNGEFILEYAEEDVEADDPSYDETDYIPARILSDNNLDGDINKFDASLVDESTNEVTFIFNNVTDAGVSGDYFAGVDEAIPSEVPTYTTTGVDDGYTDQDSWNETIPVGGPVGSIIVVQSGHTLTIPSDGVNVYRTEIEAGGTLDIGTTTKHRLGIVNGEGNIKIESNTLPSGFYDDFFTCSGGGIEYAGATDYDILGSITDLRNLTVSGSGERRLPNATVHICEDLTINGPTLVNENNVDIDVDDDLILQSGVFETGESTTITVDGNLLISGGTYQGESGHTSTIGNNVTVSSGSFVAGANTTLSMGGNLTFSGGSFNSGSGNALISMQGSSNQTITGNFTEANTAALNRLEVDNTNGITLGGDVDIQTGLLLTDGLLRPSANKLKLTSSATVSPATGSASSYVNGRLYKDIVNGGSFIFPVGKGNRWSYASVETVSDGPHEWNVELYNASPISEASIDNLNPTSATIKTISGNEYWRIEDDAAGSVTANIGIMWDGQSNVSTSSSDWYELKVLSWNGTTWDNHEGTGHESNPVPTESNGFFTSTIPVSFSTKFITMGSTTEANPLPVEFVSFTARHENGKVELEWATASELNNDYFEIQRSANGQTFKTIGKVKGAGNANALLQYNYEDRNPLEGLAYYRLRQVDFDGKFDFSNIVSVVVPVTERDFQAYIIPNPTTEDNINLKVVTQNQESKINISMIDLRGNVLVNLVKEPQEISQGIKLETLRNLPAGVYIVLIQQAGISLKKRVIVR